MRKKSFFIGLFMLLILPGVSIGATTGPYVSGQLGVSFLTDSDISRGGSLLQTIEFEPGFALGAAGGYDWGMFRVEGEIGYQMNNVKQASIGSSSISASGNITCLSFLANGYFSFVNSSPVTPYISGGIGMARVDLNDYGYGSETTNENDTAFAYQVGVGLGYAINKNMTIDLKYRYFATTDLSFDGVDAKFASHNIYLGFRYNF